ncbi:hypothetical protein BTUL_0001g01990 [Botrytis tulipae]|uniref:Uncharacterized protein n=1 Tax=Botrytis tulipae TaxID=87230 RepID=A0A4Z1FF33_9HELO|nr:hypothetical protein BTUL_0001g01990 [Botrytis tulipae]
MVQTGQGIQVSTRDERLSSHLNSLMLDRPSATLTIAGFVYCPEETNRYNSRSLVDGQRQIDIRVKESNRQPGPQKMWHDFRFHFGPDMQMFAPPLKLVRGVLLSSSRVG